MASTPESATVSWERAAGPTSKRLGISLVEAELYARQTVQGLHPGLFVESVHQRDAWFDVYGCYRDGYGWYVKVGEDDDGLLLISHHEPEHGPLTTVSGEIIEVLQPDLAKETKGKKGEK